MKTRYKNPALAFLFYMTLLTSVFTDEQKLEQNTDNEIPGGKHEAMTARQAVDHEFLHPLLREVTSETSAKMLLNPSRFSEEENIYRDKARQECVDANKGWEVKSEQVPELIDEARKLLNKGEIEAAQTAYLRYLKNPDKSDDDEPFIYEASASWVLPYAYLYSSARQQVCKRDLGRERSEKNLDDEITIALNCSAHSHFRNAIKRKIAAPEESPFNELGNTFDAILKNLQKVSTNPRDRHYFEFFTTFLETMKTGYFMSKWADAWLQATPEGIELSFRIGRLCDAISNPINAKYALIARDLGIEYVEARNSRNSCHKALKKVEQLSAQLELSSEVQSRLKDFRKRQRKHFETLDELVRLYVIDLPFSLNLIAVEARLYKALLAWPDDEEAIQSAAMDIVRLNNAAAFIVDTSVHKKWMNVHKTLKGACKPKQWEEIQVRAKSRPDPWGLPDTNTLQDSGDQ